MLFQNAPDLGNGLVILLSTVAGGDDEFALGAIHVAAPVGHEAVGADRFGAVLVAAFAPVADDGVERNARRDWNGIHRQHEAVVGRKGVHAVGHALHLENRLRGLEHRSDLAADSQKGGRGFDQIGAETADPVPGEIGAAMRGRNEDDPGEIWTVFENEGRLQQRSRLWRAFVCSGDLPNSERHSVSPLSVIIRRLIIPPML